jgi:hypothetical protein
METPEAPEMAMRKSYCPEMVEPLESRVVLSQAGPASAVWAVTPALVHAEQAQVRSARATFGVLGDTLSDEYRFSPPDRSQARNWVELLAAGRRANFGRFNTVSRGEPRNQGFARNWASFEASTSDLVRDQLPGLANQVARGGIRYVSIIVPDGDFDRFLTVTVFGGRSRRA